MHTRLDTSRPLAWERPALVSGILFAAGQIVATVYFIGQIAPHLPPLGAPAAEHARFYSDYAYENALVAFLYVLPVPFFLLFLGGLFGVLRRAERGVGVLTATALGAGVALAMVWPIGIAVSDAGQGLAVRGLQPEAVLAFDAVAQLMLGVAALPRAVLLVAVALGLRSSEVPRWVSWSAIGLAVVALIGSATLLNADLYPLLALGTLLFDIWIGASGAILLRGVVRRIPGSNRVGEPAGIAA
jgi:hypothetical protein